MLVTLIQKLNNDRDAVIQLEDRYLPASAISTGSLDEAGRTVWALNDQILKATVGNVIKQIPAKKVPKPVVKPAMSTTVNPEPVANVVVTTVTTEANVTTSNTVTENVATELKAVEQDFLSKVESLIGAKKT